MDAVEPLPLLPPLVAALRLLAAAVILGLVLALTLAQVQAQRATPTKATATTPGTTIPTTPEEGADTTEQAIAGVATEETDEPHHHPDHPADPGAGRRRSWLAL